jgi:hypothetical protein
VVRRGGRALYCMARPARGTGLGNRLFPWARSLVFARLGGAIPLEPRWFQPRLGPLLRGGIDLGHYHRSFLMMGLFRRRAEEIGGPRRIWIERTAPRIAEPPTLDAAAAEGLSDGALVVFSGDRDYFRRLHGFEAFLRGCLEGMTRRRWLRHVDSLGEIPIALHVRRGPDFPEVTPDDLVRPKGPVRTPLAWFRRTLEVIRGHIGHPARALVVSDGPEKDLRELLAVENTLLVRPGCVISDLLVLTRARVLVGSGGSSFSAWGSFLGRMPTLSLPGQSLTWFGLGGQDAPYVGEFDPDHPPGPVMDEIGHALEASGARAGERSHDR